MKKGKKNVKRRRQRDWRKLGVDDEEGKNARECKFKEIRKQVNKIK